MLPRQGRPHPCQNPGTWIRPTDRGTVAPAVSGADWMQPPVEQEGLKRYVATLRERIWIVIATIVITTGIAILYVMTATEVYRVATELRVTPAPDEQTGVVASLPLLRKSADPTRDVETAVAAGHQHRRRRAGQGGARLAAQRRELSSAASPPSRLPSRTSWSSAPTPARPRRPRTSPTRSPSSRSSSRPTRSTPSSSDLIPRLEGPARRRPARLSERKRPVAAARPPCRRPERLRPDAFRSCTEATPPSAPISPEAGPERRRRPLRRHDPRHRRGLRRPGARPAPSPRGAAAAPLPAADPRPDPQGGEEDRRPDRSARPLPRRLGGLPNPSRDPRGAAANHGDSARVILVTGSSPSEGKTTTAVNLATSLAAAGNSVILIESDLRRPSIGRALGVKPTYGVVSVLIESIDLEDALVTTEQFGSNLGLLLADYEGGWISELFALPAARQLIEDAREIADYVIVDSPPLTDVVDALPLASYVDDVLLVVRIGKTTLSQARPARRAPGRERDQARRLHRGRHPAPDPLGLPLLRRARGWHARPAAPRRLEELGHGSRARALRSRRVLRPNRRRPQRGGAGWARGPRAQAGRRGRAGNRVRTPHSRQSGRGRRRLHAHHVLRDLPRRRRLGAQLHEARRRDPHHLVDRVVLQPRALSEHVLEPPSDDEPGR